MSLQIDNPAPRAEAVPQDDDSAAVITWQDMWIAADIECARAEGTRRSMLARASEIDQQSEPDRAMCRKIAAERGRAAGVFDKIRWLIDKASTDPEIGDRLREIKRAERREAAERAADHAEALR